MAIYESIFIISPNLSDDDTNAVIKKMQDVVAKQGAEMLKFEDWGKKKLAYEIKKQKRGHYVFFQFKGAPAAVAELDAMKKNFEGQEELRQMLLSAPKFGNDDEYVDSIAEKVHFRILEDTRKYTTY